MQQTASKIAALAKRTETSLESRTENAATRSLELDSHKAGDGLKRSTPSHLPVCALTSGLVTKSAWAEDFCCTRQNKPT